MRSSSHAHGVTPLRIGFVGAGTISRHHANALEELGESIAAVADIEPTALSSFAETYDADGAPTTYDDYAQMFAEADLDAAVVAVPNALHADCAVAALDADVNVFVEKPLADSVAAARRVEAAARDSDGSVMVGFKKTFDPWFEHARRKVRDGKFGRVYDVEAEYVRRRGIPQLGSWFTRDAVAGGGAMIDIGVHQLHLALCLLGFPEVETVSATTGSHFGSKDDYTYLSMWGGDPTDDAAFDVDDSARAFLRTADGATIHLHVAWASNSDPRQGVRVYGDEAGLTVEDDGRDGVTMYSTDDGALSEAEFRHPEANAFASEWSYFADVVRGNRTHTRNTLEEGIMVQRVIDAVYESAESRREVQLNAET